MEEKILEVLRVMKNDLTADQLQKLKISMEIILNKTTENEIRISENEWMGTLEEFLLSKTLEGKSQETIKRYRFELFRLLSYLGKPIDKIESSDISRYLLTYKRIRKISNATLKGVRAVFSSFFSWTRDHNKISVNPMSQVETIKVEKKIKKSFSDEECEMLLRSCTKLRDKAILEFLYSTGVRVSELTRLNIEDIHFVQKDLTVYGKGNKERVVYINDKTNMYLKEYLNSRMDENPALFVGVKKPYSRLTKSGIENVVREIGKKAGVEKAHPHRFRRTTITNALNRGMPLQETMVLAGHSKPETTMMYCQVDTDSIKLHHKKYLSA